LKRGPQLVFADRNKDMAKRRARYAQQHIRTASPIKATRM
jgi:hypothetical protein